MKVSWSCFRLDLAEFLPNLIDYRFMRCADHFVLFSLAFFTHHLNLKTLCYLCCIICVLSTHVAVQTEATRDKLSAGAALLPFYPPLMS